jgi:hypothetical protein
MEDGGVLRVDNKFSPVNFVSQCLLPLILLGALVGCAGPMSEPVQQPFSAAKHRSIRLQSCTDRSTDRGNWNLAPEATRALTERVAATRHFEVAPEPALVFSCNVEGVVDRYSFQRGPALFGNLSEVKVAVIVWERPGDRIIATFRGFAALPPGSLDTVDAPRRLVAAAMDDVARQLEAWVKAGGDKK